MAGVATTLNPAASIDGQAGFFGFSRAQAMAFLIMLVLLLVGPFVLYPVVLMKVLCFALFACAFNLLIGYAGLMSFGHAAYFGIGCYLTAYVATTFNVTPEVAILAGAASGAILGLVFGWIAIRCQGLYFAMITMALAQMTYFFCVQAPFTGGENGIQGVPRGYLFGLLSLSSDMTTYWVVMAVFIACFLLIHRIIHSPFGQVLKAIRENEPRAISLGYKVNQYKLLAFVLSCAVAGLAGGMQAIVFGLATLTNVHFSTSGDVVLMTLLGGMGTIFGPVVGALITTTVENYLAQYGSWVMVVEGALFMVCVLMFRRGIMGELGRLLRVSL